MEFHFLNAKNRRKRRLTTAVMAILSLLWMAGSIAAYCVLFASAMVHGRAGAEYYELLSNAVPIVSSNLSVWALATFPLAMLAGFLFGWPCLHDDDYRRALLFNLLPCLNILALCVDALI